MSANPTTTTQVDLTWRTQIDAQLEACLSPLANTCTQPLYDAMHYSVFNGGKRIRPLLVYAVGTMFGANYDALNAAACAVELIHCYSLIHDDLPAMDDDALRRGKPTCHKVFGEAMAILAGDALQALAFETIATCQSLSPDTRLAMLQRLTRSAGASGMVGGQAIDLISTGKDKPLLSLEALKKMHSLKTGRLIQASIHLGALAAHLDDSSIHETLDKLADMLGLLFQIQDDILDVEASTADLGKQQGADHANFKSTYASLLGLEQAKQACDDLSDAMLNQLKMLSLTLGDAVTPLRLTLNAIMTRLN